MLNVQFSTLYLENDLHLSSLLHFSDTGNKTTCYSRCLEASSESQGAGEDGRESPGKPEFTFSTPPPPAGEPAEVQYLVKWQNWSHLHNTWETEASLNAKDLRGMKKFYNFLKRQEESELWEKTANLEDIEYVKCQEELGDQLLMSFTKVERVIGE